MKLFPTFPAAAARYVVFAFATAYALVAHAQQTTNSASIVAGTTPPDPCVGVNADPSSGGPSQLQVVLGDFVDPLPASATIRSVAVSWRVSVETTSAVRPSLTMFFNGIGLGSATVTADGGACTGVSHSVLLAGLDYPAGVPYYGKGAANYVSAIVANGTFYSVNNPIVTITYEVPPAVEFNVTDLSREEDRRILISNAIPATGYPAFQALGGRDAEVPSFLRVRGPSGSFEPNVTVYLRVIDPPDSAPYANLPSAPIAQAGDNVSGVATLDGPSLTPDPARQGVYQAVSGANGFINYRLHLPPHAAAGDNYQVEASVDPFFASAIRSGTLTAWKRVFVEKQRMLKNGVALTVDAPIGASAIIVGSNRYGGNQGRHRISPGDRIVLLHSPAIDRSDVAQGRYYEEHTVLGVTAIKGATTQYQVEFGTKSGKTVTRELLTHEFAVEQTDARVGDAIARIAPSGLSAADTFDFPTDMIATTVFPAANTDIVFVPDVITGATIPLPYLPVSDEPALQNLIDRWSSSETPGGAASPNFQRIVAAASYGDPASASLAGVTISMVAGETSSWIFRASIDPEAKRRGVNADRWAAKTAVHELAHQWRPNGVRFTTNDHCPPNTKVFDSSAVVCLLADPSTLADAQRTNDIARFHLLPDPQGGWHSEYFEIRRRPDPFTP